MVFSALSERRNGVQTHAAVIGPIFAFFLWASGLVAARAVTLVIRAAGSTTGKMPYSVVNATTVKIPGKFDTKILI